MADGTTRPRLVCFDLGGVIVRICRSWAEGCRAAGLDTRGGDGRHRAPVDGLHELHVDHQLGRIDAASWADVVSRRLDGLYSAEEILAVHAAWILGEYRGLRGLVDRLHAAGLVTAALSNTNDAHWRQLMNSATIMRLRHRLASHELGLRKPDPRIYGEAEARLGFSGTDILFFDDLAENVEAARARGWQAVLVDPDRETRPQMELALRARGVEV